MNNTIDCIQYVPSLRQFGNLTILFACLLKPTKKTTIPCFIMSISEVKYTLFMSIVRSDIFALRHDLCFVSNV